MRTIDADALKDNMFHYAAPEMVWDRGDIEHKINEMPTIDVIPVEWLQAQIRSYTGDVSDIGKSARNGTIKDLIRKWQKEQEVR
jgi:hypothetical protein